MVFNTAFWRKWHRWIAFPATLFLLFASITGFVLAFTEFFGAEEALREATRSLVSPGTSASAPSAWTDPIARAVKIVNDSAPGAPIDKIELQFKGDHPTVSVFTGKPTGGEDRKSWSPRPQGQWIRSRRIPTKLSSYVCIAAKPSAMGGSW